MSREYNFEENQYNEHCSEYTCTMSLSHWCKARKGWHRKQICSEETCTLTCTHWCKHHNGWYPRNKCSMDGCNEYDEHYCEPQKRHIRYCPRCICDEMMCLCC